MSRESNAGNPSPKATSVFISYAHDPSVDTNRTTSTKQHDVALHRQHVLLLCDTLRKLGVDAIIDQYYESSPPPNWLLWEQKMLKSSDYTLMVCTSSFGRDNRTRLQLDVIFSLLGEGERYRTLFIPVLFREEDLVHVPESFRGGSHYVIESYTPQLEIDNDFRSLYARLTGQTETSLVPLGPLVPIPLRRAF